jgi:hypothetical protein
LQWHAAAEFGVFFVISASATKWILPNDSTVVWGKKTDLILYPLKSTKFLEKNVTKEEEKAWR